MVEISFTLEGEKQLSRRIDILGNNLKEFKPEFQESVNFIKSFTEKDVFNTRGGAIGEIWKPRKNESKYKYPILERTGKMRGGFKEEAQALSGKVWNAMDYFKYHQSNQPRHRLPRRIMLKLVDQMKDKIVQIFHKGISKRLKESNV